MEIEALSAEPFGRDKDGFVDWDNLEPELVALFPNKRIPHTNLHRWHDLRNEQVAAEAARLSIAAQQIAKSFAKATVANDDLAVMNAARDTIMGVLTEDASAEGRQNCAKSLIKLGDLMQKARANDIKERKVSVDEQTLQIKLDEIKRRTEALLKSVEGTAEGTAQPMTQAELVSAVRGIYGLT